MTAFTSTAVRASTPRSLTMVVAIAVVATALLLSLYASGRHIAYTTDSLIYRDLASNQLDGHFGHMTNVETDSPRLLPMVRWPPLYPGLWGIAAKVVGVGLDGVIFAMTIALLVSTTLVLFWAGLVFTGHVLTSAALTLLFACLPSSQMLFSHAWSEALFLPMVIGAVALTQIYLHERRIVALLAAAILIGLSNCTRYVGVVFIPVLAGSVLLFSAAPWRPRLRDACLAALVSLAVVAPLWLHNFLLSGNISGSNRGGLGNPARLVEDAKLLFDLFSKTLFNFDTVLEAFVRVPLAIVLALSLGLAIRRHGIGLLRDTRVLLPASWGAGYLAFMFVARILQKHTDFDLRMLAITAPFFFLALGPLVLAAFRAPDLVGLRTLVGFVCGLILYSGLSLAQQVHLRHAEHKDPDWPSTFASHFQDFHRESRLSRMITTAMHGVDRNELVLTSYRPLYLRYLGWKSAYAFSHDTDCARQLARGDHGTILVGDPYSERMASKCISSKPGWRLLALER